MNLPKDGTNQLPKAGFDWIALKVIFQGRKLFLYFGMKLPPNGDDELWREGFDWITLKVIVKGSKVWFGSFSHISLY